MFNLKGGAEVGYDCLTGDGSRFVGCEEEKHICHVVGHTGLNLEVVVLHHLTEDVHVHVGRAHARNHGGNDGAGADGVTTHEIGRAHV